MKNISKLSSSDYDKLCRSCLEMKSNLKSIYEKRVDVMLKAVAEIEVKNNDGLPKFICFKCESQLCQAFTFRNLIQRSDKILKNLNERKHKKNKSINNDDCNKSETSNLNQKNINNENNKKMLAVQEDPLNFVEHNLNVKHTDIQPIVPSLSVPQSIISEIQSVPLNFISSSSATETTQNRQEDTSFTMSSTLSNIVFKEKSDQKSSLKSPIILHNGITKPFKCKYCDLSYKTSSELLLHEIVHTGDTSLQCKQCKQVFHSKQRLIKHEQIHLSSYNSYICDLCDKVFHKLSNLSVHMRIHNGYKPFHCKICDERFSQCSDFTIHKREHHSVKNKYQCKFCDENFSAESKLSMHMKKHPNEPDPVKSIKNHLCSFCGKLFFYKNHLIRHFRIHTGERPYKCETCNKSFTQSGSLVEHMRTHTKERPYKCEYCTKDFTQSGSLIQHLNKHKQANSVNMTLPSL